MTTNSTNKMTRNAGPRNQTLPKNYDEERRPEDNKKRRRNEVLARGPTECDINNSLAETNRLPEGNVIWSSSPTGSPEPNNGTSRPEQTEEERRPDGTYRHPLFISHTLSPLVVSKNEDVTRGRPSLRRYLLCLSQRQDRVANAIQGKTWSSKTK